MKITNLTRTTYNGVIHDIGVVGDESYSVHGVKVKNCRGIWVEILTDEKDVEDIEITGVPSEIGDYYGGKPNELIQPPRPIVQPNSPASEFIQSQKDAKKK